MMRSEPRSATDPPEAPDRTETAEEIVIERDGAIAIVWFNRPERRNAFDEPMMLKLAVAIEDFARTWPDVRVVVFAGRGPCFGAGGDLEMLIRPKTAAEIYDLRSSLGRIFEAIEHGPQICIAAIHGHCVGSALVLAGCCDFRICVESARFLFPEINSGMLPGIGVARIGHVVPDRMMRRLLILGTECPARDAYQDGFATEVVADDDLMTAALDLARRIAAKAPHALAHAKRIANHARTGDRVAALDYERLANETLMESDDVRDRLRSFVARRNTTSKP